MFMKDKYIILNDLEEFIKFILIIHSHNITYDYLNWLFLKNFLEFQLIIYGFDNNIDITINMEFITTYKLEQIDLDYILKF